MSAKPIVRHIDYRRLQAERHPTWLVSEDNDSFAALFDLLNAELQRSSFYDTAALTIQGHDLQPLRRHGTLAWFSFAELCEKPRSARDYLQLADHCTHLLLSGVPRFGSGESAPALASGAEDGPGYGSRRLFSSSEKWMDVRRLIDMAPFKDTPQPPAVLGHSRGEWRDGTLLITTGNFTTGVLNQFVENFAGQESTGILHSNQMVFTETLSVDPATDDLVLEWTANDPAYFSEPFSGSQRLVRSDLEIQPYNCVPDLPAR